MMKNKIKTLLCPLLFAVCACSAAGAATVSLSSLDLKPGTLPKSYTMPLSEAVVLTPKPSGKPRINGPSIFGVRPGSPFLYRIPVTGERPVTYAVEGLPAGLTLDAATGRITGSLGKNATCPVTLRVKNALGQAEKPFRIVVGDQIALTPPLGWNSWNCWGGSVSQEKVLASARALVEKGLDQHGWTYVNIDDGWQGVRGGPLNPKAAIGKSRFARKG